jgi:hypothetical protein
MRMLRREPNARLSDFAGERVNGRPLKVVRRTLLVMDIDEDGLLDVDRLTAQQFARFDDAFPYAGAPRQTGGAVIDAMTRFVARGGAWEPDLDPMHRIESAALGRIACARVRVVR